MKRAVFAFIQMQYNPGEWKILSVSRKGDFSKFGFPGGGVEPGESNTIALHRELEEELGIDGEISYQLYTNKSRNGLEIITYLVKLDPSVEDLIRRKVPFVNKEGAEVTLRTAEELRSSIFGLYNGEVFKAFLKAIK